MSSAMTIGRTVLRPPRQRCAGLDDRQGARVSDAKCASEAHRARRPWGILPIGLGTHAHTATVTQTAVSVACHPELEPLRARPPNSLPASDRHYQPSVTAWRGYSGTPQKSILSALAIMANIMGSFRATVWVHNPEYGHPCWVFDDLWDRRNRTNLLALSVGGKPR